MNLMVVVMISMKLEAVMKMMTIVMVMRIKLVMTPVLTLTVADGLDQRRLDGPDLPVGGDVEARVGVRLDVPQQVGVALGALHAHREDLDPGPPQVHRLSARHAPVVCAPIRDERYHLGPGGALEGPPGWLREHHLAEVSQRSWKRHTRRLGLQTAVGSI